MLRGHTSRIWSTASTKEGTTIASASGDGSVKLWDVEQPKMPLLATLDDAGGDLRGDVYSVQFHPAGVCVNKCFLSAFLFLSEINLLMPIFNH